MKIRRQVLPVTIIVLTDEGLCRMANWSPVSFADMPTSNEYLRWVVLNDDCRMCCSIDYRQLAIP